MSGGFMPGVLPATAPPGSAVGFPLGATPIAASSGNQTNATAAATLPGAAGKTTYLTAFHATGSGSTLGLCVSVTVTGVVGGPLTYTYSFPIGILLGAAPLIVPFDPPLPASAQNQAITVSMPAGGLGNTNASVVATGFQV